MTSARRVLWVVPLLALAALIAYRRAPRPPAAAARPPPNRVARLPEAGMASPPGQSVSLSGGLPDAPSHLADDLNSPATDIHSDLRIVNELFDQYRSALHGDNPVGENREITAVLTGKNALGFAFIPASHPAINARGELCDRWGTPFFFHSLAAGQMEIRSAGPDKKLWTPDDEVLTPGLTTPQL